MGHKVDYTGDSAALYAVQPDRRGHHDGQFPCNFAQVGTEIQTSP